MNPGDVAVATISLARTADEAQLLRTSLAALGTRRFHVSVSDGGSAPEFVRFLESSGFALAPAAGPGLVGQVKASVRSALRAGTPFILYTEPDKLDFFQRGLEPFVRAAPVAADVAIVVAARDEASFATFPEFQRHTESGFNVLVADLVGADGDYCYGPFLMRSTIAAHLERAGDDLGWGWRPFLFQVAHRLGGGVVLHAGSYPCPPDQRLDNDAERLHRLRQLRQNVDGLIASY